MLLHNSNNKLENDVFVHIAKAPDEPILESQLPFHVQITEIVKTDLSSQEMAAGYSLKPPRIFEADMIDFMRCDLQDLSSIFTLLSHGVSKEQFLQENKTSEKMAIYIYKKR